MEKVSQGEKIPAFGRGESQLHSKRKRKTGKRRRGIRGRMKIGIRMNGRTGKRSNTTCEALENSSFAVHEVKRPTALRFCSHASVFVTLE